MKDTDKVTMTIGQLKKLVKESYNYGDDEVAYQWSILTATKKSWGWEGSDSDIATSDDYFDTPKAALNDAMKWLRDEIKTPGDYMIQVSENWDIVDEKVVHLAAYGKMFFW